MSNYLTKLKIVRASKTEQQMQKQNYITAKMTGKARRQTMAEMTWREAVEYLRNTRNSWGNMPTVTGETANEIADIIEHLAKKAGVK